MASHSEKSKYFGKKDWPYALFIMDNHFQDTVYVGEERISILDKKRLFTYCLHAAVEIHLAHYYKREAVYKSFTSNVLSVLYNFQTEFNPETIAEQLITDIVEEFFSFLTHNNATHILEHNPTILKWLPNGVIISYDDHH